MKNIVLGFCIGVIVTLAYFYLNPEEKWTIRRCYKNTLDEPVLLIGDPADSKYFVKIPCE